MHQDPTIRLPSLTPFEAFIIPCLLSLLLGFCLQSFGCYLFEFFFAQFCMYFLAFCTVLSRWSFKGVLLFMHMLRLFNFCFVWVTKLKWHFLVYLSLFLVQWVKGRIPWSFRNTWKYFAGCVGLFLVHYFVFTFEWWSNVLKSFLKIFFSFFKRVLGKLPVGQGGLLGLYLWISLQMSLNKTMESSWF